MTFCDNNVQSRTMRFSDRDFFISTLVLEGGLACVKHIDYLKLTIIVSCTIIKCSIIEITGVAHPVVWGIARLRNL